MSTDRLVDSSFNAGTTLNEADTCTWYVVPMLREAAWDSGAQSFNEQQLVQFTAGRIVMSGHRARRKPPKRADYLLKYTRDFTIAVVEAKAPVYDGAPSEPIVSEARAPRAGQEAAPVEMLATCPCNTSPRVGADAPKASAETKEPVKRRVQLPRLLLGHTFSPGCLGSRPFSLGIVNRGMMMPEMVFAADEQDADEPEIASATDSLRT